MCIFPEFYTSSELEYSYSAIKDLQWHNIWSPDNPAEVLNEHVSLLVGCYVPTGETGMIL